VPSPALDAALLERYLGHYAKSGLLPPANRARIGGNTAALEFNPLTKIMEPWLKRHELSLRRAKEKEIAFHNGIFNEVAAARVGGAVGIRRFDVDVVRTGTNRVETLDVLLKSKPSDAVMQQLLVDVATLCDPELGALCDTFRNDLGLSGSHERELALYGRTEPGLRQCMPRVYGTICNRRPPTWSIAMEYLDEADTRNLCTARWTRHEINGVLRGLARLHAEFYLRGSVLNSIPWLDKPPGVDRMCEMSLFWTTLANFSARFFDAWLDETVVPLQKSFVAGLADWWPEMQSMPATLVHNDCNPRNLVIRRTDSGPRPVFFDWELATIDVPQRDLAELLCFVLPTGSSCAELEGYLEFHRRELESASAIELDRAVWLRGFILALRHLLINRLPLYTLIHRFRPQAFLPSVIRNWQALYRLATLLSQRADRSLRLSTALPELQVPSRPGSCA
jgi:hypothetical protein